MNENRASRQLKWISWSVLILSPFLLLALLSLILGQNVFAAQPVWLDELSFWRSLHSWNEMGFDTGYYGMFEETAVLGTQGIAGLSPILIYGWFIKLFGMSANTIMLCNAVWISVAAAVFCLVRKPRPAVAFSLAGLVMGYMPIILYSTTSMTQLFNYALMFLYLAFLLTYQEKRCPWAFVFCFATVVFGCLYSPMYCVLFIPLVMFISRYRFGWKMILTALAAVAVSALCCFLGQLASAPNAQGFPYHLIRADHIDTFIHMLLSHSKANLLDYFRSTGNVMQNAFRVLYMGTTLLCLLGSFMALERRGFKPVHVTFGYRPPFFSCFLLLIAAFGLTIMLYDAYDWRDYRRLAPYLWLVIAFFITRHRFTLPVVSLAACAATVILLIASPAMGTFSDTERLTAPVPSEAVTTVSEVITYDENAEDPFANTIRIDVHNLQLMQEIHPGMGMQYGWFTTDTTGKSRWILTDQLKCPVTGYEKVLDTGDYKVYKHIDD